MVRVRGVGGTRNPEKIYEQTAQTDAIEYGQPLAKMLAKHRARCALGFRPDRWAGRRCNVLILHDRIERALCVLFKEANVACLLYVGGLNPQ